LLKLKRLKITIDYSKEHDKHNHDLVGYIIQRYPHKVVKANVLTRESVDSWYEQIETQFPRKSYIILVATVSLVGEVLGAQEYEVDDSDDTKQSLFAASRKKDTSAN
jgi:hypothetical protein